MEPPDTTEIEEELQGTQRHRDEEDMRGTGQDDDLPVEDAPEVDDEGGRPDDDRD